MEIFLNFQGSSTVKNIIIEVVNCEIFRSVQLPAIAILYSGWTNALVILLNLILLRISIFSSFKVPRILLKHVSDYFFAFFQLAWLYFKINRAILVLGWWRWENWGLPNSSWANLSAPWTPIVYLEVRKPLLKFPPAHTFEAVPPL